MTQNREIGAAYSSYCISHLSFFVNITYSLIIFHMRSLNMSKLPVNSNAHMDPIRYTMHLNHVWYTLVIMTEIVVTYSTRASIVHKTHRLPSILSISTTSKKPLIHNNKTIERNEGSMASTWSCKQDWLTTLHLMASQWLPLITDQWSVRRTEHWANQYSPVWQTSGRKWNRLLRSGRTGRFSTLWFA